MTLSYFRMFPFGWRKYHSCELNKIIQSYLIPPEQFDPPKGIARPKLNCFTHRDKMCEKNVEVIAAYQKNYKSLGRMFFLLWWFLKVTFSNKSRVTSARSGRLRQRKSPKTTKLIDYSSKYEKHFFSYINENSLSNGKHLVGWSQGNKGCKKVAYFLQYKNCDKCVKVKNGCRNISPGLILLLGSKSNIFFSKSTKTALERKVREPH